MYVPKETSKIRLFVALCGVSIKKKKKVRVNMQRRDALAGFCLKQKTDEAIYEYPYS